MDESQDDALAMAQAMGFSSFGTQNRPQKRRKFTAPATSDAHPESASQSPSHPQSQPAPAPAPAPELAAQDLSPPHHAKPAAAHGPATNADEISLEDGDDDDDDGIDGNGNDDNQEVPNRAQSTLAKPPPAANLPARPPSAHGAAHPHPPHPPHLREHQHPHHTHQQQHVHRPAGSGFNPRWYEGYYDPSSNENPWLRLEASLGLEARGPWLSRA